MAQQGNIEPTLLSGSTDGRPIAVATTSSPGTTIHTADSGTATRDYITLYAANVDTTDRLLYLQWGGTSTSDQVGPFTIRANEGATLVIESTPLQNGLVLKAYSDSASKVNVFGKVSRATL